MKKCFKCGEEKERSEFYAHPAMGDGLLGKCKECTKKDTAARMEIKMKDATFANKEAERHRKKQAERRRLGLEVKQTAEGRSAALKKSNAKYPEKRYARSAVGNAIRDGKLVREPCLVCGSSDSEAHHDDYSRPLDVLWLCPKHHAERHVEIRNEARRAARACLVVDA